MWALFTGTTYTKILTKQRAEKLRAETNLFVK